MIRGARPNLSKNCQISQMHRCLMVPPTTGREFFVQEWRAPTNNFVQCDRCFTPPCQSPFYRTAIQSDLLGIFFVLGGVEIAFRFSKVDRVSGWMQPREPVARLRKRFSLGKGLPVPLYFIGNKFVLSSVHESIELAVTAETSF